MTDKSFKTATIISDVAPAKLNWTIHRWSIFWLLILFPIFASGTGGAESVPGALMLAGGLFIKNSLKQKNSYIQVTDKNIVLRKGIISKTFLEMPLEKFESVFVHQGVLGRALNYGTVVATGTGGVRLGLEQVASPMNFKQALQRYLEIKSEDH